MEKPQSSYKSADVFSMTPRLLALFKIGAGATRHKKMDTTSYKCLLNKTQEVLCSDATNLQVTSFATLLKDCSTCINQSLNVVTVLLSDAEVCIEKLKEYLSDAVFLLGLLPNFLKNIIGSELLRCCASKNFPTSVGLVIKTVFSHCKNSDPLYGSNLSMVAKQLKDLFRNCHELQLTYLLVLEKHFSFDLTDMEEKKVLLETLEINMKIGETVPALDVKTMAVQWKAMTMIYEKYSAILADTSILQECMSILCPLIKSSIESAVEANHDDKAAMRSMKIANFLLKTLLKACDIFEHASRKEYNDVINLLFYVYETSSHLEMTAERSQFMNLIENPSECLLKKLLCDETFAHGLLNGNINKIQQEGSFLGFVVTITSVMDCLTQGLNNTVVTKKQLINCLYSILSECNSWNLDVILWSDNGKSHGLFEHLVIHALALALTLNCEEYSIMEKKMIEAILSTDHISALFSSSIWTLLHMARDINPQLPFNQIVWLCTMYKKLEKRSMFHRSPQKLQLSYTITRLFSLMENDDKMKICKQFRIHDDDNLSLWTALGVRSLPQEAKNAAEAVVIEKMKTQFQYLNSNLGPKEIDKLTKVMSLAASCTFHESSGIEPYIMKAWSKTCPERQFVFKHVHSGTAWFYDYMEALIALTDTMWHQLCLKNVNLINIHHCVTGLLKKCGVEFKLLFINTLIKLATTDICESKLDDFKAAFTCIHQTSEDIVRKKLCITLKQYRHKNIDRILSNVEDPSLRDSWFKITHGIDDFVVKDELKNVDYKYIHKCIETIETRNSSVLDPRKSSSGNFDFVDDDHSLFGMNNDLEESVCKKVKLDNSEAEAIIKRLETETALLRTMKEKFSPECRSRIRSICEDLDSIIN